MEYSEQQVAAGAEAAESVVPAPARPLGFFHLPLELRLEIFEFTMFSATSETPALPCTHGRIGTYESLPAAVEKARLVGDQFGREFATAYYKWNTVLLPINLGDLANMGFADGVVSNGKFPFRKDYGLVRKLEMDIYIDPNHATTCQWCYWHETKTSRVRPLFQHLQQDGERRSWAQVSFPCLESLHLRFISRGDSGHYFVRQMQIGRAIKTLAQAIPAQAKSRVEFHTGQSHRNDWAEGLFRRNHGIKHITDTIGRPLWFQCDPPLKYGGCIQGWIDRGLTYFDIIPRIAQIQFELLQKPDLARLEPRDQRERQFRRMNGWEFEVVVVEMWGREKLEDCLEQGRALKERFVRDMEAGLAVREAAG